MHPIAGSVAACCKSARLQAPASCQGRAPSLRLQIAPRWELLGRYTCRPKLEYLSTHTTVFFLQLKSRVLMTPLAISPPRSTPEPDVSSIPQDAATVPKSTTPQALTGMWTEACCSKGVNRSHSWQPASVLSRAGTVHENGTSPGQTDCRTML